MEENGFWKICEALDCERRLSVLAFLLAAETTEFLSVCELAEKFNMSEPSMSVHLKKLAGAGLVVSKRADRRVYYRAFPTTAEGERVLSALRKFFEGQPDEVRVREFVRYVHALSHHRRNAIIRCLAARPGMGVKELAIQTDMPPQTADRLWSELGKAHIVDLRGMVVRPAVDPEDTLLDLTLS